MTLSVCCPTADPGRQVHATLESLRAVADEIVVAADRRTSLDDLAWYGAVADRLYTFEFTNAERIYAWLHAQCRCDWIFLIEGDECASPGLIEMLPELTRQRAVGQFYIPRRWLYPDAAHWIDESPWWPDLAMRLVRNDGSLFFPGTDHSDPVRADPVGFVDEPIYHFSALAPLHLRRAKIERYQRTTSDLLVGGARPVNETYYLPEDTSRRPPALVPERDRIAVDACIRGSPGPTPGPARGVVNVALAESDRYYARRPFAMSGYQARLEPFERDLEFAAGEQRGVLVQLTNEGTEIWPWGLERPPHLHLSYELYDLLIGEWVDSGVITPLPHTFEPGATGLVPVTLVAPLLPGSHQLRIDLRHAGHRRFGHPLQITLTVR